MNLMEIKGYKAVIQFDPEIEMFRGEFTGLNGGADFYAKDIDSLKEEGKLSLKIFLKACKKHGIQPRKEYSGKFNLRIPAKLHAEIASRAAATGKSLNQWLVDMLSENIQAKG